MIDLRRYNGLLVVALGVTAAVAVCSAALLAGFGEDPAVFNDPDRQLAWSQLERMGAQVAGVEMQMRRQGLNDQPPFGVVLGQSTTLRGIDPVILKQKARPRMRWLPLNGFGSSFVKLNFYAQTLLASKLRPTVIVLGLHETMLAGQDRRNVPTERGGTHPDTQRPNTKKDLPQRVKDLITSHWVRAQRANINHFANTNLFELRLSLHRALDSGAVGLFHPGGRPWRASVREELPTRHEKRRMRQRAGWSDFGWFDPQTYDTTNRHADAFRKLIAGCDRLGAQRIVIVLMPVTSDLRSWLPPEATQRMRELIDEVSVGRPVRVIDLRDAMPDDAFADYAHLNPAGREVFSRLLAQRLSESNPGN
jgi:hypothetical protein